MAGHLYRVVVRFKNRSGFSRDDVMNTFWIASGGAASDVADLPDVRTKWEDFIEHFYNVDAGTDGSIASYLSPVLSRASNAATMTWYSEESPGEHLAIHNWTLAAAAGSLGLPNQIALCLSYESTHVGLEHGDLMPLNRRRGRLFIGPLTTGTLAGSDSVADPPPRIEFIQSLCDQAAGLVSANNLDSLPDTDNSHSAWCVASRGRSRYFKKGADSPTVHTWTPDASPIGRGWVDNVYDTQRRRVIRETSKHTWSI